jgi:hypothetical protein
MRPLCTKKPVLISQIHVRTSTPSFKEMVAAIGKTKAAAELFDIIWESTTVAT